MYRTITYYKPLLGLKPTKTSKPVINKIPKNNKDKSLTTIAIKELFDGSVAFSSIFFSENKWAKHDYICGPILILLDIIISISFVIMMFSLFIACVCITVCYVYFMVWMTCKIFSK